MARFELSQSAIATRAQSLEQRRCIAAATVREVTVDLESPHPWIAVGRWRRLVDIG